MGKKCFENGAAKRGRGRSTNTRRGGNVCVSEKFEYVNQSEMKLPRGLRRLSKIDVSENQLVQKG